MMNRLYKKEQIYPYMMTDQIKKNNSVKIIIVVLSIALFIYSLTQKCYCTTSLCGDSIAVFLSGWMGVLSGGAAITWLANPLLLLSWIMTIRNSKYALIISVAAILISLSFLLFDKVIDDEAGHYNQIVAYRLGYWLWVSSTAEIFIGNIVLQIIMAKKHRK